MKWTVPNAIAASTSLNLTAQERNDAIVCLLDVLEGEGSRNVQIVSSLKLLGRTTEGTKVLATLRALQILLRVAGVLDTATTTQNEAPDTADKLEAWRIVCNTLRLHEEARTCLDSIDGAVQAIQAHLSVTTKPSLHFLSARIIFLLTVKGQEINRTLVEDYHILNQLHDLFVSYGSQLAQATDGQLDTESNMALSEILKVAYNIVVFYPRLVVIDPKAASPTLEEGQGKSKSKNRIKSMFKGKSTNTLTPTASTSVDILAAPIIQILLLLRVQHLDSESALTPEPPLNHAIHTLSELPTSQEWFGSFDMSLDDVLQHRSLPTTASQSQSRVEVDSDDVLCVLVSKLLLLLDVYFAHVWPCPPIKEADDEANRKRIEHLLSASPASYQESKTVDAIDGELTPLVLLLRKCIIGDSSMATRNSLRHRLLSSSMDRAEGLDQRADLTGRLVRLMSSLYFSHLKVGAGELLFALCGQDAQDFAKTIGYGPAAGFLTSNGLMCPPPEPFQQTREEDGAEQTVNPITGAYYKDEDVDAALAAMSEEEKEREAERLFVLFDRLAKTGVMNIENPVRQAQQSGRFEEIEDDDAQQTEDQDEHEAEEEMRRYRARMGKT